MADHLLPDFKINKDEPENGVRSLIEIIKPHWNHEGVKMEPISGGYSSKIFKCFDPNDSENALTVRIRFAMDNIEILKNYRNEIEPKAIQHLATIGHFPKVHSIFANGYCYQYIKGEPIQNPKLKTGIMDDKMLESTAKELVFIHSVKLEGVDYTKDECLPKLTKITEVGPVKIEHELAPTKEILLNEFQFIKDHIKNLNLPIVLCHGDPHPGNFVWNKKNDKITFVDWEGSCIGYRHVEIAKYISAVHLFLSSDKEKNMVVPDDFDNKFLSFYFHELCKLENQEYIEEEYQDFKKIVRKCQLAPSLMYVSLCLMLPTAGDAFFGDNIKLFELVIEEYFNLKEEVFGRRQFEAEK